MPLIITKLIIPPGSREVGVNPWSSSTIGRFIEIYILSISLKKLQTEIIHALQQTVDDNLWVVFVYTGVPTLPGDSLFPVC